MRHFASISFGKDSLAMLLTILDWGMPLDEVVFYDTGMEFEAIYRTRDRVLPLLKERGILYTELKPKVPFLDKMLNIEVHSKKGGTHLGYSWCGGACRWGTSDKLSALKKHIGKGYDYVGIAADEVARVEKERRPNRMLPLVDWGITERQCLEICYRHGFFWEEQGVRLYDILDRVSCWCCANKNNRELLGIYRHLPAYWLRLKELEGKNRLNFRVSKGESIVDIEQKIQRGALKFRAAKEL